MNEKRVPGQQSVERAIDVLFCFDSDNRALTAAAVAARLGLNRTTAWRYLQTLAGAGLLREVGEGKFALGGRTVRLAEAYTSQWGELATVAGTALVRLRDAVGETAGLHVRQGWSRVVVAQVESRQELHRTYRDLGEPITLLAGAPSLAILACLPDAERDAFLEAHLDGPDQRRVDHQLAAVRAQGYAVSRGSRVPNVASIAAPLLDGAGGVIGAINVTGPASRFGEARLDDVAGEVSAAAEWVQEQIRTPHAAVLAR